MSTSALFQIDSSLGKKGLYNLLERSGLQKVLCTLSKPVLIKPNLVENLQPPITTPVELVADLISCLLDFAPHLSIYIAEGCGSIDYETEYVFEQLGYAEMAAAFGVGLKDLNSEALVHCVKKDCRRWPEMYLPQLLFDSFVISVPVLKAHSLAGVTLSMKNMMGAVPPKYYQQGGHWKKASFHNQIHEAVFDLNQYRCPDFCLLDASVGMQEAHLWGPTCNPPHKKLVAGFDPVALDSYGARLLGRHWQDIGHIKYAHGVLGTADPIEVSEL